MKPSILKKSFSFQAILEMLRLTWQAHPLFFLGIMLFEFLKGLIPLGQAWITKLLFDFLAESFQRRIGLHIPLELLLLLIGQAALLILSQVVNNISRYMNIEMMRQLSLNIQSNVYNKINSLLGLAPFEAKHFHDTIQLATEGAQSGPQHILTSFTSLVNSTVTLISFIGILLLFNPVLAGFVMLSSIPQLYYQIKLGRQHFSLVFENSPRQRQASYYGSLLSSTYFAKEMRLLNLSSHFLNRYKKLIKEIQQSQRNQQVKELHWQLGLSLISNIVYSMMFVAVILQAFAERISLGDITLYTNAVNGVQGALSGIIYAFANINESTLFFSHYYELMAIPQPIHIPSRLKPIPSLISGIEIKNVSFRYSQEHPWILKDVSLTIPAGKCLALVGLNGAGKTTLVKLLTRLYEPTKGQILWNGTDIREFDPVDLRNRLGVIFQDFVHFDLTAFENIALGDVIKIDGENNQTVAEFVQHAAAKAGIHESIIALPQGYQTTLSRWLANDGIGVDMSGGEWQKIALARLLMRDPDILILDEPTAALDAQAEFDVYHHFVELVSGKTSFLISHRFSTVRLADIIAVLEDGRITELGSHEELIALGRTYAYLYNLQAERYM